MRKLIIVEAAHDVVGPYNQDEINGFSDELINHMLELVNPATASNILDAMAGNGNLSKRLVDFCKNRGIQLPSTIVFEYSRVQAEYARALLSGSPVKILWGDILTLKCLETGEILEENCFDRVMTKSANHEISSEQQKFLYENIYRILKPGGLFVNLGFLFDNEQERNELREITRVKDSLIGMHKAAINRHFLTRNELYSHLKKTGFVDIKCGKSFDYKIHSAVATKHYFSKPGLENALLELQASQAKAMTMRKNGRIIFDKEFSLMICPGEITVAKKPTWAESNAIAFSHCPYDFLRRIEAHSNLLTQVANQIGENSSVLDLACGPGLAAERMIDKNCKYLGIDISESFIRACKEKYSRHENLDFILGDINIYDLGKNKFDVVTILNTIFLAGIDSVKVLTRSFDALKKGGKIIVSGPTSPESFKKAEPLMKGQLEKDGLFSKYESDFNALSDANEKILHSRGNYWSIEGMEALLKELGFKTILASTQIYYGFGYLVIAEK